MQRDVTYPSTAPIPGMLIRLSDGIAIRKAILSNATVGKREGEGLRVTKQRINDV